MINYVLLVSRQGIPQRSSSSKNSERSFISGKLRLAKWYATLSAKTKNAIVRDVTQLVMSRKSKMCNVLEYKGDLPSRLEALFLLTSYWHAQKPQIRHESKALLNMNILHVTTFLYRSSTNVTLLSSLSPR